MRVLYDGAIYSLQAFGGISRYFAEVISRLPSTCTPIVLAAKPRDFPAHPNLRLHCDEFEWWPKPLRILNRWAERRYFDRIYSSSEADVLHPTYYSLLSKEPIIRKRLPIVLTVHDFIHERFPAELDPNGFKALEKRRAIELADSLICVSESTKRDLIELFGVPSSKISVIYHSTGFGEIVASPSIGNIERPYFLFVGSRAPYKNFDRLLEAIGNTVKKHPDVALYVAGNPFTSAEVNRIESLGLAGHVFNQGRVDDPDLKRLYQDSIALVYPSLYEGFGIPPLEAMACGTAVVAANTSSIPEVVGSAGLLFPPDSTADLTDILCSLLEDTFMRQALVEKGRQQAAKFSWDRAVAEHLSVYKQAA